MFYALVLLAAASRFLPHPPNVACVGALGLFAGCYLSGIRAYLVPVAVMLISDVIGQAMGFAGMGFYNPAAMAAVYVGMLAAVPVGRLLAQQQGVLRFPAASLVASTIFFLVSNFGVWLAGWYTLSAAGLVACYVNAIPFYGYTLAGDLVFTTVLFGAWEFARRSAARPVLTQLAR